MSKRSRAWVWTAWSHLNQDPTRINYTTQRVAAEKGDAYVTYICYQREKTDTGQQHWQGYMETSQRLTMKKVKDLLGLGNKLHVEARRGNQQQGIDYTKKTDTRDWGEDNHGIWRQFGQLNPQLQFEATGINDHATMNEIMERVSRCGGINGVTMYKYFPFINKYWRPVMFLTNNMIQQQTYKQDANQHRRVDVTVLFGPSGAGKTTYIKHTYAENGDLYILEPRVTSQKMSALWWDNYTGQDAVLLDDLCPKTWEPDALLRITSGTGHCLNTKGGTSISRFHTLYITTNFHPDTWWDDTSVNTEALTRRLKVILCDNDNNPEWREQIPLIPQHNLCRCMRDQPHGDGHDECKGNCHKFTDMEHCTRPGDYGTQLCPIETDTTEQPPDPQLAPCPPPDEHPPRTTGQHAGPRTHSENVNIRPTAPPVERRGRPRNTRQPERETQPTRGRGRPRHQDVQRSNTTGRILRPARGPRTKRRRLLLHTEAAASDGASSDEPSETGPASHSSFIASDNDDSEEGTPQVVLRHNGRHYNSDSE